MPSSDSDSSDDFSNLDIASVLTDPNRKGSTDPGCQPTTANLQSAANDKPSTSGISTLPSGRDPATMQISQLLKHKLFIDNEPNVVPKKRRLMLTDISDREWQGRDAVCDGGTGTRNGSSDADHNPEENEAKVDGKKYWDPEEKYTASGLKQTLHGVVYQLKHLMLVLHRAWKKGYSFRLSTEMDAAEKFDDLVLEYVDNARNKTHRFVQLKHKKDNAKTISARDLLDVKDGEFSVLKYFVSWRKIKKCSSFDGSQTKTFTLCTNIGLDVGGLSDADIGVSVVGEPDDFLEIPNRREQPPRYKLQTSQGSELYETLKFASDVHRLARELAERVRRSQDIHLTTDIMKRYHAALKQEVVDVKTQKFTTNFIRNRNLSARAENFRDIFFSHTKKLSRRNATDQDIWNDLEGSKLKISANFGTKFELSINPKLAHVQQFSDEFVKLVNNAWKDGVVKIDRRIYNKRANELSVERIFADNIDKLAGHVLVTENKKIKFGSRFLTDVTQLLGNMEEFRDVLKTRLGSQFDELDKFEFEINNFKTCAEDELFSTDELPDDDISAGEILDFLDGFVLAVDQPDEKELGDMIEREIGDSRFDLPDAKFFTDSLEIEILDWFKETGKQSVFLANENARDIFVEIEGRLSSLVTRDLRSEYPAKLEKWGIRFKSGNTELCEFVQSLLFPPCQILVISSGQTLLTALRIYQTLESLRELEPRHGFIFVRLERLFETKILDEVLRTFEWRDNHNLLVVDCESIRLKQYTRELWNPVCRILAKNTGKKMILIVQDNQDVTMEFRVGYKSVSEKADDLNFVALKKISQQKLLERKVAKFQGQDESFGRLLGIRNSGNISADKLKRLRQIIEPKVLVQLIKGEEIQIGSGVEGLGPVQNYYIPRRILRHSGNITDSLEDKNRIGVFTYLNEEDLVKYDPKKRVVIVSDTAGMGKSTILTSLAVKMKSKASSGTTNEAPPLLIIRINLTQHTNALNEQMQNRTFDRDDVNGAVDFLVEKLSSIDTSNDVALLVYKTIIKDDDKVALFFDGFDEISPTYNCVVMDLLQALAKLPINKLFVTSRPYTIKELENKLKTSSYKLDPLSPDVQRNFLKQFWKMRIGKQDWNETLEVGLETHAEAVINLLTRSISPKMTELTGVPLQARMVAEIFPYSINDSDENQPELPEKIDIVYLYQQFLRKKYEVCFTEKYEGDLTNPAYKEGCDSQRCQSMKVHQKFALDALFDEKTVRKLLSSQPAVKDAIEGKSETVVRFGIIARFIEGKPHFVHRTFAEYLAADFLTVTLTDNSRNKDLRQFFVEELFVSGQYEIIRAFKNALLSRNAYEIEPQSWCLENLRSRHWDGNTLYHSAALEGNIGIIRFFLNCLRECREGNPEEKVANINLLNQNHRSPLLYALRGGKGLDMIKCLVEGGANINEIPKSGGTLLHSAVTVPRNLPAVKYLVSKGVESNRIDCKGMTPLHKAAYEARNPEMVKYLCNESFDVNCKDSYGRTPLHWATLERNADVDVVKCLVEQGADFDREDEDGETPLHFIRHHKNLNIFKYLCDEGADFMKHDSSGLTLLHFFSCIGNSDGIEFLCDKRADVNCRTMIKCRNNIPLYWGANSKCCRYQHHIRCWETHTMRDAKTRWCPRYSPTEGSLAEYNLTPLHLAAVTGNWDIYQLLLERGADPLIEDTNVETPLAIAKSECTYWGNYTEKFIQNRTNVNVSL